MSLCNEKLNSSLIALLSYFISLILFYLGLKTGGQDRVPGPATATRSRSAAGPALGPGHVTAAREDPGHVTEMGGSGVGRRRERRSVNRRRRKRR